MAAPCTSCEQAGRLPNGVFACGRIRDYEQDRLRGYHGAADTSVSLAMGSTGEIVDACIKGFGMNVTQRPPVRVIWSALHTGSFNEAHVHRVIDRAAAEGVSGVELSGRGISEYILYRDYPALAADIAPAEAQACRDSLARLTRHAAERELRFGIWHHEIDGPQTLFERLPQLRAADGLIDLGNPELYRFVTSRLSEFCDLFPLVDEIVLTMTETDFPVFRRPFCSIPVTERIRRLLAAVLEAIEPRGKLLVIRPFSALREDELHVRKAVELLRGRSIAMMYKTEPFDWHPFLMNEPLIGSVPGCEARAETDAGAEYYGQTVFPCSYTRHIATRLSAALDKGASTAVIRVDRGAVHAALGHPINEANVIVPTRWLLQPGRSIRDLWGEWFRERHGTEAPDLFESLERTFEVMGKTLYIDRQAFTHNLFPDLRRAKHVQAFGLFEEDVPLAHMHRNWGVLADRRTLTHEGILAEKAEALALAEGILRDFGRASGSIPEPSRSALRASLANLPILVHACTAFCRTCVAHLEEAGRRPARTTDAFEIEAGRLLDLADAIEREHGAEFWLHLPSRMRDVALGLAAERAVERPLRREIESSLRPADYILCGFASEGHRLGKMLHAGRTFEFMGRWVRETGIGEDEGIRYVLNGRPGRPHRLTLTVAGDGETARPGVIRAGAVEQAFDLGVFTGFRELDLGLPAGDGEFEVFVFSATPRPCRVAQLTLV